MHRLMESGSMEMVSNILLFIVRLIHCAAGFDEGSPDGHDPLQLAREMAGRGITLVSFTFYEFI